jgi:glutathione S-transferase
VTPTLTLYVVPGSPPCAAVEVALRIKRLDYRRVDLPPVVHMAHQRAAFGRRTVPGMAVDGQRVVGSRLIMRALDGLAPAPRLLPDDPARRARIEEAETWGDAVLQSLARRLVWAALQRRPGALTSYAEGYDLPLPPALAARGGRLVIAVERLVNRSTRDRVRQDLDELDGHLGRIDAWLGEGRLGDEPPNAADLQIGSSLALLKTIQDLAPRIASRPCDVLVRRHFPSFPGEVPRGALPPNGAGARRRLRAVS